MSTPARLLITGATGNVGGAALRCLLAQRPAGTELAVATREPARDRQGLGLSAAGVNRVPFDFTKPETVAQALRGVAGLLLVRPPAISDVARYLEPVVQAAVAAGVGHVVFLSLQGAQYNPFVPHHQVEGYLKEAGIRYSLLRPSFFMQDISTTHRDDIRRYDQLLLPAGHARTSFVDAEDVGAAAAKLLLNHARRLGRLRPDRPRRFHLRRSGRAAQRGAGPAHSLPRGGHPGISGLRARQRHAPGAYQRDDRHLLGRPLWAGRARLAGAGRAAGPRAGHAAGIFGAGAGLLAALTS